MSRLPRQGTSVEGLSPFGGDMSRLPRQGMSVEDCRVSAAT
jgi:hypothetical protein